MNPKIVTAIVSANFIANLVLVGCSTQNTQQAATPQKDNVTTQQSSQTQQAEQKTGSYAYVEKNITKAINLQTGEITTLLPKEYEIINQHGYGDLPEYFIVQKEETLLAYNIRNKTFQPITINPVIKEKARAWVYPSITEKNKFIIQINHGKPVDGMYDFEIKSIEEFTYDANTNTIQKIQATESAAGAYSTCKEYDSKNDKIYFWLCGEGIGSSAPLISFDLKTRKETTLASESELGITDDLFVHVWFNQGKFYLQPESWFKDEKFGKIMVVETSGKTPIKTMYTFTGETFEKIKQLKETGVFPYSMMQVKEKNSFIIGMAAGVIVMKYDDQKRCTDITVTHEDAIYLNFLSTDGNAFYYKGRNSLKTVDLESTTVTSIPFTGPFEEIGLINNEQ